jgi:tetratricopeptide (TPR) repeat protein
VEEESAPPADGNAGATEPLPLAPAGPIAAPTSLNDVTPWIEYKVRGHIPALPQEAHLFYRRALMLHASGGQAEAIALARAVIKLDPGFVAPRLTLAGWLVFREPGESIDQWGGIVRLARDNFMIQIVSAANALYLALQALFLAVVLSSVIVVAFNQGRLRHGWTERLAMFVTPETASKWSWAILIAPYLAGLGPALPSLVFLGLLWPTAKLRERSLFVLLALTLAGVPLMTATLDRLSAPLQGYRAPFFGVPQLQTEPYSPERRARFEELAEAHPDNPFLSFAAGWLAQREGDPASAERHYLRTLELWPDDDRVLNNLGNAYASQGRQDEAVTAYRKSIGMNPRNAAAHLNISDIYTMRYDFQTANREIALASALDFDLVKTVQSERAEARWAALADQWARPGLFWRGLKQVPFSTTASGALPPLWRTRIECSGWVFSILAFLLGVGSIILGLLFDRAIPVRGCGNCGRAICRRCAERRREMALCSECTVIWSRAQSPEFGRVLLFQHRRRKQDRIDAVCRIVALLVPGFGYLPYRKLVRPVVFLAATSAMVSVSLGIATPFDYEPRFGVPGHDVPLIALGLAWLCFYAVTLPLYVSFVRRAQARAAIATAPTRRRSGLTPSGATPPNQAAA